MQKSQRHQIQILTLLSTNGHADTQALTAKLGLSESSLSRVMREMVANQLVEVSEAGSSRPGRPPQIFRLKPSLAYAVGVEITTTVVRWTLVNAVGDVLKWGDFPLEMPATNEELLERIERGVSLALADVDVPHDRIRSVGIVLHAFVDHKNAICISCRGIPGPQNVPIGAWLRHRFGLPAIVFEEGRAIAYAESRLGSMQSVPNFVAVTIGHASIGTGIVINRELYLGETNMAGHLAHIIVDPGGPRCICGAQGCVEVMASCRAIIDYVLAGLEDQVITSIAPHKDSLGIETIAQAAERGDRLCYQALVRAGELTGIGIGTLSKVLNINQFVMHGTLPRVSNIYLDSVKRTVRLNSLPLVEPAISVSALPAYAVPQGAALFALNKQLTDGAEEFING